MNRIAAVRLHARDNNQVFASPETSRKGPFHLARIFRIDVVFDNVYDWERGTTADQVEAAARASADGLRRYVFMSSIAAYGGGLDRDEDDTLAPAEHPDAYGRHKAESRPPQDSS